jgi:hypothetical protein
MPSAGSGLIEYAAQAQSPPMITFALEQRVRAALSRATQTRRFPGGGQGRRIV